MIAARFTYTWDTNLCAPYESTWSLLQKFAMLNACNTRDIQREFGGISKRAHPQNWSNRDRNLHGWGALDSSIIQQRLGLTDFQIQAASTLSYIRTDEAKVLASQSLRICPQCVREGFHTPFHQLLFIPECPIHKTLLTTHCFECGTLTAPYSLHQASFQTAYGCGECGTDWWQGTRGSASVSTSERDTRLRLFNDISDWLTKRKNDKTIETEITKLARFMDADQEFHVSVRQLPHRWADVLGVRPPHHFAGNQRDTDLHVVLESREIEEEMPGDSNSSSPHQSFSSTYRAIRRHLTKRTYKHHRGCFEKMGKGIWFPVIHRELDVRQFCQIGYALLLWRMLWEKVDVPQKFFSRQLRLIRTEVELVPDWIPSSLPQEVAQRLFGMECLRTYRRCCELAAQMQHKDRITFPVWRLSSRRPGEWIIHWPKSTSTHKIHWWWPKRWESTLGFEPHSPNAAKKPDENTYWIAC